MNVQCTYVHIVFFCTSTMYFFYDCYLGKYLVELIGSRNFNIIFKNKSVHEL